MHATFILLQVPFDLGNLAEKATLVGVLLAFCWYFLNQLKTMQQKRDDDYKLFLTKHEELINKFFLENAQTTQAINNLAASMEKLADNIDELKK